MQQSYTGVPDPQGMKPFMSKMATFLRHPGHGFWPDDVTLFDLPRVDAARLLDSAQLTDTYLLPLAVAHKGRLATFDRHLVTDAVTNWRQSLLLIA